MKKIVALLFVVLMLCACGTELAETPSENPENNSSKTSTGYDYAPKDHSYLISVREETNGTKEVWTLSETGGAIKKEMPDTLYYLEYKDGTPIVDHPFSDYIEFCYENLVSTEPETWEHCCVIEGDYDGNYYRYEKNEDGVYILDYANMKYEKEFGDYIIFDAYGKYGGTGIKNKEGEIVLPPVYGRIYMPFADRIVARQGLPHAVETQREFILDMDMNFLNGEYNYIEYYYLDEENCIGVGACVGERAETGLVCYDKDGNVCEEGYWFVDKDGNKISEKFEYISVEWLRKDEGGGIPAKLYATGTATIKTETGKEIEILVKDYVWNK